MLPWLWPFLIAWAGAAALEPLVGRLCRRGWKRPIAAGACLLGMLAATLGLLGLLLSRAAAELGELLPRLPGLLSDSAAEARGWKSALDGWSDRAPGELGLWLGQAVSGLTERLGVLPAELAGKLPGILSGLAAEAPSALLFSATAVIGTYFISASYPELLHGAARLLPDRFLCRARLLRRDLRRTLGHWLRAQMLMGGIVCAVTAAAFLLLGVRYALLLAVLTAAVDALPVLGAGAVLLPWAAWAFLNGDAPLGTGLAITYAALSILRSCIQAKLLGDRLGLHPLATLAAIYAGWKLCGIWGMLIFPVAAVYIKEALPGFTTAWRRGGNRPGKQTIKEAGRDDRSDFQHYRRYGDERTGGYEHQTGRAHRDDGGQRRRAVYRGGAEPGGAGGLP